MKISWKPGKHIENLCGIYNKPQNIASTHLELTIPLERIDGAPLQITTISIICSAKIAEVFYDTDTNYICSLKGENYELPLEPPIDSKNNTDGYSYQYYSFHQKIELNKNTASPRAILLRFHSLSHDKNTFSILEYHIRRNEAAKPNQLREDISDIHMTSASLIGNQTTGQLDEIRAMLLAQETHSSSLNTNGVDDDPKRALLASIARSVLQKNASITNAPPELDSKNTVLSTSSKSEDTMLLLDILRKQSAEIQRLATKVDRLEILCSEMHQNISSTSSQPVVIDDAGNTRVK